jgi:hypothetical protein
MCHGLAVKNIKIFPAIPFFSQLGTENKFEKFLRDVVEAATFPLLSYEFPGLDCDI